jgi:hypothetical protein
MERSNRWQPNDWLRLIALVGAFGLFATGVWLLVSGIAADGTLDLKSSIISGTLKTASAGLYVCFFALVVITFVLATLASSKPTSVQPSAPKTRSRRLYPLFWASLASLIACVLAALMGASGTALYSFIGILSFGFSASLGAIIRAIAEGD